jgi:streptogramin lyase
MHRKLVLLTLLAVGAAVAVTSLAAAAPLGSLALFPVPAGSVPFRIASGADGNLWYSDQGPTKAIGRLSTAGAILDGYVLPAGSFPRQVRVGPDGNFWYTDTTTPAIGRIAQDGTITQFHLAAGSFPNALAIGADGNIWFTDRGTVPAIGRITPTGTLALFSAGLLPGSLPQGIAPGADGSVWFTDQGTTRAIGRVAVDGTIVEFTSGLNPGTLPAALTPGPDGNIWFTDQGATKAIGHVTPAGAITETNVGLLAGSNPGEITPGADGNLWFGDNGTTKAIGEVTPAGVITELTAGLGSADRPGGLRTGADGNLWLIDNATTGQRIAQFGVGAPAASVGIAISGGGNLGAPQVCADAWNDWAGAQPSHTAFGFDGYQWLLDGTAIAGATAQTYSPTSGDVGHQLACSAKVTYTLFPTTVTATSAAVPVQGAAEQLANLAAAVVGVGPGKNLASTVAVAQFLFAHGATRATCVALAVFALEVRAQSGKKIPTAQAAALVGDANRIRAVIGC